MFIYLNAYLSLDNVGVNQICNLYYTVFFFISEFVVTLKNSVLRVEILYFSQVIVTINVLYRSIVSCESADRPRKAIPVDQDLVSHSYTNPRCVGLHHVFPV